MGFLKNLKAKTQLAMKIRNNSNKNNIISMIIL